MNRCPECNARLVAGEAAGCMCGWAPGRSKKGGSPTACVQCGAPGTIARGGEWRCAKCDPWRPAEGRNVEAGAAAMARIRDILKQGRARR